MTVITFLKVRRALCCVVKALFEAISIKKDKRSGELMNDLQTALTPEEQSKALVRSQKIPQFEMLNSSFAERSCRSIANIASKAGISAFSQSDKSDDSKMPPTFNAEI
jgi:hypothetical protein